MRLNYNTWNNTLDNYRLSQDTNMVHHQNIRDYFSIELDTSINSFVMLSLYQNIVKLIKNTLY